MGGVSVVTLPAHDEPESVPERAPPPHRCGHALRFHAHETATMSATCECGEPVTVADACFATSSQAERAEWMLSERLRAACGFPPIGEDPDPPWQEHTFDHYDASVELCGVADTEWMPTAEQRAAIADLGFQRLWVNYGGDGEDVKDTQERYWYGPNLVDGGTLKAKV